MVALKRFLSTRTLFFKTFYYSCARHLCGIDRLNLLFFLTIRHARYIITVNITPRHERRRIFTVPDDHLYTYVFYFVLFLLLTAMFSLTHFAVREGVESSLRKSADDGDRRSGKLLAAMEHAAKIERDALFAMILASALGCLSSVSAFLPALGGLIPENGHTPLLLLSALVISLISALIYYTFAVLLPRTAAEHDPVRAYSMSSFISRPCFFILRPFSALASAVTKCILLIFGVKADETENVTEDEIRDMIDAGEESGSIESTEKEMIENVFDFSDVTASDVMTHRTDMEAIDITDEPEKIERLIRETGFSRIPVYEDDIDNITGILYVREYLLNRMSPNPKPIEELIHDPIFTPERVRADVLFREMQKSKIHMAIVLDEYGGTSGLVTMEDLLEEIFGNIYDEFDEGEPLPIEDLGDGKWRVAGSVDLETLSETIGHKFDDEVLEEYDTLGGLVFSCLSLIPDDGERPHVQAFGLDIQVEVFADRRVEWATVSVIPPEEDDGENSDEK